jgi:hypothetical protein
MRFDPRVTTGDEPRGDDNIIIGCAPDGEWLLTECDLECSPDILNDQEWSRERCAALRCAFAARSVGRRRRRRPLACEYLGFL